MKYILATCILLIAVSCEDKSVLSMERGIYYYKQNKINLETTSAIKSLERMKDNVCKDSLIQLANYCAERDK